MKNKIGNIAFSIVVVLAIVVMFRAITLASFPEYNKVKMVRFDNQDTIIVNLNSSTFKLRGETIEGYIYNEKDSGIVLNSKKNRVKFYNIYGEKISTNEVVERKKAYFQFLKGSLRVIDEKDEFALE